MVPNSNDSEVKRVHSSWKNNGGMIDEIPIVMLLGKELMVIENGL